MKNKCGNGNCKSHIINVNPECVEIEKCENNCAKYGNSLELSFNCRPDNTNDGEYFTVDMENKFDCKLIHQQRKIKKIKNDEKDIHIERNKAFIVLKAFDSKRYEILERFDISSATFIKYCRHVFGKCNLGYNSIVDARKNPIYLHKVQNYYESLCNE